MKKCLIALLISIFTYANNLPLLFPVTTSSTLSVIQFDPFDYFLGINAYSAQDPQNNYIIPPQHTLFGQNSFQNIYDFTASYPARKKIKIREEFKKGNYSRAINSLTDPPTKICINYGDSIGSDTETQKRSQPSFTSYSNELKKIVGLPGASCGYSLKLTKNEVSNFCKGMNFVSNDEDEYLPINCSESNCNTPTCHKSNCTTASFLSVLEMLKKRKDWYKIKNKFECHPPTGLPNLYLTYGGPKGLEKFFEELNKIIDLGDYKKFSPSYAKEQLKNGWPKSGDILHLDRKAGSGHSAIFDKYEFDENGNIEKVCYWTSNYRGFTKGNQGLQGAGTGPRCESISKMATMHFGRISGI